MIRIANAIGPLYLPLDTKDCWQCTLPGGGMTKLNCAYPASQCKGCGHIADYIALWRFNGACKNGNTSPDDIKIGQTLMIPNCVPKGTKAPPTKKPTKRPTESPTDSTHYGYDDDVAVAPTPRPSRGKPTKRPTRAPSDLPTSDDTLSSLITVGKHILDGAQKGINDYKAKTAPTPAPTPRPNFRRRKVADDDYATSTAYAA